MKTLAECKTEGERLRLLLDFEPAYSWPDLLVRKVIYFVLLAAAGTVRRWGKFVNLVCRPVRRRDGRA